MTAHTQRDEEELREAIQGKVVMVGAGVLTQLHRFNNGDIERAEYERQLDDILFPNTTNDLMSLIDTTVKEARIDELENVYINWDDKLFLHSPEIPHGESSVQMIPIPDRITELSQPLNERSE